MELPDDTVDSFRRPAYVYHRPKTNMPSLGTTKREVRENNIKNNKKIALEFDKIREMLDMKQINVSKA
jgi:hypothetical protein